MAEAHAARDGRQSGAEGEEVGCSRVGSGEEKELGQEERLGRPGFAAAWVGRVGRVSWACAREGGGRVLGQRRRWTGLGFGFGLGWVLGFLFAFYFSLYYF